MDVQVDGDLIRLEREEACLEPGAPGGRRGYRRANNPTNRGDRRCVVRIRAGNFRCARDTGARFGASDDGSPPRLRFAVRWLGAALALAIITGTSGFLLLADYKKVRVLRTLEHWVTSQVEMSAGPANRSDGR